MHRTVLQGRAKRDVSIWRYEWRLLYAGENLLLIAPYGKLCGRYLRDASNPCEQGV